MAILAARPARASQQPALPHSASSAERYTHNWPPRPNRGGSKHRPRSCVHVASPLKISCSHPKKGTEHRLGGGVPVTACVYHSVQSGRCCPSSAVPSGTLRHFLLWVKCCSCSKSASSAAEKRLQHLLVLGLQLGLAPGDPTTQNQCFLRRSVTLPPGIGCRSQGREQGDGCSSHGSGRVTMLVVSAPRQNGSGTDGTAGPPKHRAGKEPDGRRLGNGEEPSIYLVVQNLAAALSPVLRRGLMLEKGEINPTKGNSWYKRAQALLGGSNCSGYKPLPSTSGADGHACRERETVPRRYGGSQRQRLVTRAPVACSPHGSTAHFPTVTADPSKKLKKRERTKKKQLKNNRPCPGDNGRRRRTAPGAAAGGEAEHRVRAHGDASGLNPPPRPGAARLRGDAGSLSGRGWRAGNRRSCPSNGRNRRVLLEGGGNPSGTLLATGGTRAASPLSGGNLRGQTDGARNHTWSREETGGE